MTLQKEDGTGMHQKQFTEHMPHFWYIFQASSITLKKKKSLAVEISFLLRAAEK